MRSLKEATESWKSFQKYTSLADLKQAIRHDAEPTTTTTTTSLTTSRSLLWRIFLLFERLDHSQWLQRTADSRSAYASVRTHLLRALEHPEEVLGSDLDPLSGDAESPWTILRQDETLRAEIMQDVDRCMPDNLYFRQPHTQAIMLDILFVFCKLNPDVGYRQGMHELLAPILWVLEKDAVLKTPIEASESTPEHAIISQLFDSDFVEHDTFTLFGIVMQGAKSFYEQAAHKAPSKLSSSTTLKSVATLENPILTRIHRIFDDYLPHFDPTLAKHLRDIDLIPQVFLMRWIRLLFGREFAFDDVLAMWDAIFTDDPSLEIVDLVCLNMILRLHWDLINADYNTALTILLRYPPLDNQISPQLFVTNAIYLRENFTQAGASTLVEKYTGKPLPTASSSSSSSSTTATSLILPSTPGKLRIHMPTRSASNFEDILQGAAKGVFQRGEKWGINKALRDAVEEVKKGVREIQAVQTPQLPVRHTRRGSGNGADKGGAVVDPSVQLVVLERRNVALSKMLKKAIDDLWLHHESVVGEAGTADKTTADDGDDEKKKKEKSANALSMAIAKVQFVQVYLEDASVPLFSDEEEAEEVDADTNTDSKNDKVVTTKMQQPQMKESSSTQPATPTSKDTEAFKADTPHQPSTPVQNKTTAMPTKIETETETTRNKTSTKTTATTTTTTATKKSTSSTTADKLLNFQTPRPTLAQSSFSWMLGQSPDFSSTTTKSNSSINSNSNNNNFAQAKALAPSDIRRRSRGFLFGHDDDDDDDDDDDKNNNNNSNTKGGRNSPERRKKDNNSISGGKRGKKQQVKKDVLFEQDAIEEEFDLGALEEEKKKEREKAKAEAGGAHGIKGR